MNKEYEYSFYVEEIEPYIQYCEKMIIKKQVKAIKYENYIKTVIKF